MDNVSTEVMLKALDGLTARAELTASNIANANTPSYRARHLSFEKSLAAAADEGAGAVRAVQPSMSRDQHDMRLDLELSTASSTSLRYAALIDILSRQLEVETLAIKGVN